MPMKRPATNRTAEYDQTMSIASAARLLGTNRKRLRLLLATGRLNFMQIRGSLRIPRDEIRRLVKKCHDKGDAPIG